jgi:hypothetical protein
MTYWAIDCGITTEDKKTMLSEIKSASGWEDNFRGCQVLQVSDQLPNTLKILEQKVFSWMHPRGRINVLKTPANKPLADHMDSKESEIGMRLHKFRIALSGDIETLYFYDEEMRKVYVPNYDTYVMDGTHVHGVDPGAEEKVTLCIGSPWTGLDSYKSEFSMSVTRPNVVKEDWIIPRLKIKNVPN